MSGPATNAVGESSLTIGVAVGGVWTPLLVGRYWKAERGWIDRLGRAVGFGWIVLGCWDWLYLYSL